MSNERDIWERIIAIEADDRMKDLYDLASLMLVLDRESAECYSPQPS